MLFFYSKKADPILAGAAGGMSLLELVSDNTPFGDDGAAARVDTVRDELRLSGIAGASDTQGWEIGCYPRYSCAK